MSDFDLDYVRRQFPALASGFVYMDNAGGSQTLGAVVDNISEYLLTSDVQLGASYEISQLADARVQDGTQAMATYINAAHTDEVVMGPSTSYLIKTLASGIAQTWDSGDEVIVTNTDHEANVSPWTDLEKQGFQIKVWKVNPNTLQLEIEDLVALMTSKTRLVAVTHASNLLGTINPIREIAATVHQHGALICVDGVAYMPHRLLDVQALDVDFYSFSFYKVYGPHYAMLYGKRDLLAKIPGNNLYFIKECPYKFQPGNVNFELCYGMSAVPAYFRELAEHHTGKSRVGRESLEDAFDLISDHEEHLADRFLSFLNSRQNVRIIGDPSAEKHRRVPTISFVVEGKHSETFPLACDPHQIGIRWGDFYAKKLVDDLGLEAQGGVVRVSLVHYNTLEEVDRLIHVLEPLI